MSNFRRAAGRLAFALTPHVNSSSPNRHSIRHDVDSIYPKDPGILRTATQHIQVNIGVYASVLQDGKVQRGDSIRLE